MPPNEKDLVGLCYHGDKLIFWHEAKVTSVWVD